MSDVVVKSPSTESRAGMARSVLRIDHPEVQQGMTPAHRVRALMPAAMRGEWAAVDPFLALMEDWFPRGVFGPHPHRGMETMTYVIDGRLEHRDNHGGAGTLTPGDAQWMTAGRGIVHAEEPVDDDVVHGFQLWINLPAANKLVPPRYQDLRGAEVPVRRSHGAEARIFSGESEGIVGPARNYVPVTMVELRLQPGASLRQELPADYNTFVVLIAGSGRLGKESTAVTAGDIAWLTRGSDASPSIVEVAAGREGLRALLIGGRPLREPVAARGPFVMNSDAEIAEAYADYRAGKFGPE